ncbi:MAG TPA: class I SAM-dependent methyltransferase [Bacteroidetes bacterium]|nr:class I SAM-dependent methyltransferase [Bacteroidota bacterium]
MKTSLQKAYWDKVATEKNFTLRPDFHLLESGIDKDAFIVDWGCGYGRTLEELYRAGYRNMLGLDFSGEMIARGQKSFPYLNLQIVENIHTNLPDNSVDMVLLFALLTCIKENEEQQKLMKEIRRILKPGGWVYVIDFLLNNDERNRNRYVAFAEKYGVYGVFDLPEGAILRHHEESYVKRMMKDFTITHFEKTENKTMNGHISNGFVLLARKE